MPKIVTLGKCVKVKVLTLTAVDKANLRLAIFPVALDSASLIVSEYEVQSGTLQHALITPASLSASTSSDRPSSRRLTSRELIRRDNEDRRLSWAMTEESNTLTETQRGRSAERGMMNGETGMKEVSNINSGYFEDFFID